jgi:hypothetical protein
VFILGAAVLVFALISAAMWWWERHAEYQVSRRDYMDQLDALIAADRRARMVRDNETGA